MKKVSDDLKAELVKIATAGGPSAADFKKILTELGKQVTALASTGGESKVAAALRPFGAEATKAAAAADPASAADNPAYLKAGQDLTAVCAAAGVKLAL
ncbi:hypothetical protein AB0B85_15115 [Micromonospora sp. NPDC049044]|uniref:hypothetical protein n=1 Tax=unclassified Micromonospora TaxID=2617518 RepID=UPI0033CA9D83